jgi:hypothetical protein
LRKAKVSAFTERKLAHCSYPLGENFCFLVGKLLTEPKNTKNKVVWFSLLVPDLARPPQKLVIPCACRRRMDENYGKYARYDSTMNNSVAQFAWDNLAEGDEVAVTGKLWTAYEQGTYKHNFIDVLQISSSLPTMPERDPRYVRVRVDLWNRVCKSIPDMDPYEVPENMAPKDWLGDIDEVVPQGGPTFGVPTGDDLPTPGSAAERTPSAGSNRTSRSQEPPPESQT